MSYKSPKRRANNLNLKGSEWHFGDWGEGRGVVNRTYSWKLGDHLSNLELRVAAVCLAFLYFAASSRSFFRR